MLLLQRPGFCPIHSLTPSLTSQLSDATLGRGVDVGCALILESSDGRILLTRRAAHMTTFPGIWVPPGKHTADIVTCLFRDLFYILTQSVAGLCSKLN